MTNLRTITPTMQNSMRGEARDMLTAIRGDGSYWLDPKKRRCSNPECNRILWAFDFQGVVALKCRPSPGEHNYHCFKLNQIQRYVKRGK
jgi:hypothetical protein